MKSLLTTLLLICMMSSSALFSTSTHQDSTATQIQWLTNYQQAVQQSKETSKPIVLFFTGSDWCQWCQKLKHEVLDSAEFIQSVGNKFIFVEIDLPRRTKLDPQTESQNKRLQNKYSIKGFPTVLVIDSNESLIGPVPYHAGGVRQFVNDLQRLKTKD